jgi:uncharacterized protein (DUF1015 family)
VGELSRVLAPPYDVISGKQQAQLHEASPYNIVRLILGKDSPADTETANRYTRAGETFAAWCADGVLQPDLVPALYVTAHTFRDEQGAPQTRLGFTALMELDESTPQGVYRHEATLTAPKADRMKLLEAVPANLSPIFCVYPDEGARIHRLVQDVLAGTAPIAQASLPEEIVRLWVINEPDLMDALARHLASVAVLIADGHHRFEVAYATRHRYRALMSHFVSMGDPALIVRPLHRVVRLEPGREPAAVREFCALAPIGNLEALNRWLNAESSAGSFGYYDGRGLYKATPRSSARTQWQKTTRLAPALASLDVSLLHGLILPRLGVDPTAITDEAPGRDATGGVRGVQYVPQAHEALRAIDRGEADLAWFVRGLPLQQVYALAAQGLLLPPKSTYFYPKLLSGLTINPHTT